MKLSKEELDRIAKLKTQMARYKSVGMSPVWGIDTVDELVSMIDKLQNPKPERFTYEYRHCGECFGGPASSDCDSCGGLGKIKTKIKRTAHSV